MKGEPEQTQSVVLVAVKQEIAAGAPTTFGFPETLSGCLMFGPTATMRESELT